MRYQCKRVYHLGRMYFAFTLLALFFSSNLFALEPINKNAEGVTLKGFDPVAYFTESKPLPGRKEFQYEWSGAKWYFVNQANRESFMKDPAKYAPQYGGYCAYAVSKGYTADISPKAWKIVGGKLYLNNGVIAASLWGRDIPGNIEKAEKNWPEILRQEQKAGK